MGTKVADNIFLPGDLVVSLSGRAAPGDTTAYTDNQATPLTLDDLSTSGTVKGTLVLPQTTVAGANGSPTQYAFSAEYGSSSEGLLSLSADGQSLTIGGYAVNAGTYNSGGAAVYGDARLAQSTSVQGGTYTAVQRLVADIRYDGTVDTSTAAYNVFNKNNIRSVVTDNGSSFYIAGQGVKGDTTQGVFLVKDGATSATAIDTSTDTRALTISSGALYVSRDSTQGTGGTTNIASYGTTEPTGATAPTTLPGLATAVTLNGSNGNSINGSTSGTSVNLSPESFFFANSSTLYVADTGNPKQGGLGDGGLQKWSLIGGKWTLDYTVSAGLNLVSNKTADPGQGGQATTGLIGLAGKANADGTVSLYATNSTVGDLNATYVYATTDALANTTAPTNQSFTRIFAAPAGSNVRGIAFAPIACYLRGTLIRTKTGDVPVQHLAIGDFVVTATGAHRPIRWIGHRDYSGRFARSNPDLLPIRFAAGALAEGVPSRDLYVSPKHAMSIDGALIPAECLVNGSSIARVARVERISYWHVELDSHDVLLAEGAPSESFVDDNSRLMFHNADDYVARYGATPSSEARYCAPRLEHGPVLETIRHRLALRVAGAARRLTG